jgi:ornithine decarboxylase
VPVTLALDRASARTESFAGAADMVAARRPTRPVYCLYPRLLRGMARRFLDGFPGDVLFAVKANPEPRVLQELHGAGVRHFDTASLEEIDLVRGLLPDARCYFMAPSKLVGAAEAAYRDYGVRDFVADHDSEVARLLAATGDDATVHVRMKAHSQESIYELSSKFGAEPAETARLLSQVAAAGRRPGLAFNVGSMCLHPDAYRRAIAAAARVVADSGVAIASLDVGGGFPSPYPGLEVPAPEAFFAAIAVAAEAAGLPTDCRLLCEPGRALVAEGQSLVVQVILVKDDQLFLNDGIYGSLSEPGWSGEKVTFPVAAIRPDGGFAAEARDFAIAGPTCDTGDVLPVRFRLPADIRVGDWIEIGLLGAYSNAMRSRFNGFHPDDWARIEAETAAPPGVRAPPTPARGLEAEKREAAKGRA